MFIPSAIPYSALRDWRSSEKAERHESYGAHGHSLHQVTGWWKWRAPEAVRMRGAQSLLKVRHRFLNPAAGVLKRDDGFCSKYRDATQTGWVKPRERWVLLKIPRCGIDGVGEVK